ncbi:MAG: hypothetical protein M0Z37_01185 [Nitrospiraceae bacterium]|nr:hypothetical protein [Nitrospiraceae bacterium]
MDRNSVRMGSPTSSRKEDFLRGLGLSRRWSQIGLFQIFHFPEILRTAIAIRQNEKSLDAAIHELGDFVHQRKDLAFLDEGEMVEWDLLRGRVLRFMEERSRLLRIGGRSDLSKTKKSLEEVSSAIGNQSGGAKE